ncbi:MAG: hypothetical protein KDB22_14535 [Planctomycetales bacterium]|nr:hypothetical protein [Planctomycetales bacterium]
MRLGPGQLLETDTISTNPHARNIRSEVLAKPILIIDNGLTVTYVNKSPLTVARVSDSTTPPMELIEFPSAREVARSGTQPAIQGIMEISPFNQYGRRNFTFMTSRGPMSVLQGITEINPVYAKVEVLRTQTDQFEWDLRITPASIPRERLREILFKVLDPTKSGDWLRVVRFYMQAERYLEAREILTEAIERFPSDLAASRTLITQLDELYASQKFNEIKVRRQSGQRQLAAQLLLAFPESALPVETQVELEDQINSVKQEIALTDEVIKAFEAQVAKLPPADQQAIAEVVRELVDSVNLVTVTRLSDFQVLRRDASLSSESLVSYALGGWLLGSGAGIDNFAVAKSLIRVRELIREYLDNADLARRQQILAELQGEEGAQPEYLARLLATMRPPQSPSLPREEDLPGLFRLQVNRPGGVVVNYVVQLPPEYDPNQKYPCILGIPGRGDKPEVEVDLWCGAPIQGFRIGPATRRSYIVVSPDWMLPEQSDYQYTELEHDRILSCLRDAMRKFSIDTDRVFVTGHLEGATAAWDIAQSHPDLWAGAVMVSPGADKYILHYSVNVRAPKNGDVPLATYIVYGQFDGTRFTNEMGSAASEYVESPRYDSIVVEYRGNGRTRFPEECGRILDWMELSSHRRKRFPRSIETKSMRPGDRFFYWLEAPASTVVGNTYQFDPTDKSGFEARLLPGTVNGIVVSRIPSYRSSALIWLSPDMVDFNQPISISVGSNDRRVERASNSEMVATMLEDARQRGDRMHVFWQRVLIN